MGLWKSNVLSMSLAIMSDPGNFPDERFLISRPVQDPHVIVSDTLVENNTGPDNSTVHVVEGVADDVFRWSN
jgi:hypothetical protein